MRKPNAITSDKLIAPPESIGVDADTYARPPLLREMTTIVPGGGGGGGGV